MIASAIHSTAAPMHSDSVAGRPFQICSVTFCELAYDVSSPVKIFLIIVRYCTGSGWSRPRSAVTRAISAGLAFLPAIRAAGIGVRDHVEDQEDDHRDREEHRDHSEYASGDESGNMAQCSSRILARGSSASRRPSPNTLSDNTVSTISKPGTIVRCGAV